MENAPLGTSTPTRIDRAPASTALWIAAPERIQLKSERAIAPTPPVPINQSINHVCTFLDSHCETRHHLGSTQEVATAALERVDLMHCTLLLDARSCVASTSSCVREGTSLKHFLTEWLHIEVPIQLMAGSEQQSTL